MKQLCTTHHFYHTEGTKCPYCEKDRVSSMAKKYTRPKIIEDTMATLSDVAKLSEKYNVKFQK